MLVWKNDLGLHWFTVINLVQSCTVYSLSSSISEHTDSVCLCELLYELIVLSQLWCWNVSGVRESSMPLSCVCLLWWGAERLQRILIRPCHFSLSFLAVTQTLQSGIDNFVVIIPSLSLKFYKQVRTGCGWRPHCGWTCFAVLNTSPQTLLYE